MTSLSVRPLHADPESNPQGREATNRDLQDLKSLNPAILLEKLIVS